MFSGLRCLFLLTLFWAAIDLPAAVAGMLGKAEIESYFPDALRVLDRDRTLPVWPIVKLDGPRETVVAYVFESIDLAPTPGFAGVPFNLLIALDRSGTLLEVRVLTQHEPVFLDGLGPEPLLRFVEQYRGRRLDQGLRVLSPRRTAAGGRESDALDGVSKATASVRIVNETVLAAALEVARGKLGYAPARPRARVRETQSGAWSWEELLSRGLVVRRRIDAAAIEGAFAGSAFDDPESGGPTEYWAAYLNAPDIGRSLLGNKGWQALHSRLEPGQHAFLVYAKGPRSFLDEAFVRGAVPERLKLRQSGLAMELRDLDLDLPELPAGVFADGDYKVFRVAARAGFDPGSPWELGLEVVRRKGALFGEVATRAFALEMRLPETLIERPQQSEQAAWRLSWTSRAPELAALALMLLALGAFLTGMPRRLLERRPLARLRWVYLALTLVLLGWTLQGQVSVVQLAGMVKALGGGHRWAFLLFDPITCVLLGVIALSLLVWGRGTFCGWLCPFGALQEFVALAARRLRIPAREPGERWDRRLATLKYALAAAILGTAAFAPEWSDVLAQAEPFKAAMTLGFQGPAGPLAYALATLVFGAFYFKAYCRWLCPLGAVLAVGGRLRSWNWLIRRKACGKPCQVCRRSCRYRAIGAAGQVDYSNCFQCLDCVSIYHDSRRCAPLRRVETKATHRVFGDL